MIEGLIITIVASVITDYVSEKIAKSSKHTHSSIRELIKYTLQNATKRFF